jgi:hypothetical protein
VILVFVAQQRRNDLQQATRLVAVVSTTAVFLAAASAVAAITSPRAIAAVATMPALHFAMILHGKHSYKLD